MSSQTARNLYSGIEEQHYFVPPTAALYKRIDADEYEVVVMQMLFFWPGDMSLVTKVRRNSNSRRHQVLLSSGISD